MKAIKAGGPAAVRMRALFKHVQKSGKVNGQYGMSNLDEFVAEAFTNPKFQEALKGVPTGWINAEERVAVVRQYRCAGSGLQDERREDGARPGDDDRGAVDAGDIGGFGYNVDAPLRPLSGKAANEVRAAYAQEIQTVYFRGALTSSTSQTTMPKLLDWDKDRWIKARRCRMRLKMVVLGTRRPGNHGRKFQ